MPQQSEIALTFPTVTGSNLNGVDFTLPRDFEADVNLVFLAFLREQQNDVDTWLPFAADLENSHPDLHYYELPTLTRTNGLFRSFIDGGMRSGIRDPDTRSRTITLYLDRPRFLNDLGLTSVDTITTLLVRRNGEVLWLAPGPYTDTAAHDLESALAQASEPPSETTKHT